MRGVLFLAESFHPVLGGGETHLRNLASRLAASGLRATVLTRRGEKAWPAEETLDGVRIVRVPPSGPGRRGKYAMVPFAVRALGREAGRHDVVVVRGTRVLGLPGLVAARTARRAVVLQPEVNGELSGEVYTWGTPLDRGWGRRLVRGVTAMRNRLLRDAEAFVAMSRRIEDEMLAAGLPRERVAYLPHGVDTRRFRPAETDERRELRLRLALDADALVVVYTGRLLRGKGLESLLEAFARVAAVERRARLVLVGSGRGQSLSVEEELRQRAARDDLGGRVVFTGGLEDVAPHLRAADVFAFPSLFEALGLSLLEAAACGLPAVGSRTGGIVDVIEDGRSGLLVRPGDVAELAAGLSRLLADAGLRQEFAARARAVAVSRFDLEDSVDRYRALFREAAARRGARPS